MVEHLDVACASAPGDHPRVQAVGEIDQFIPPVEQRLLRAFDVGDIDHLDLADEDRRRRLGVKPAGKPRCPRGAGKPGDDGRLLHGERYDDVAAVDQEIQPDSERQAQDADHVLDHLVGRVTLQRVRAALKRQEVFLGERRALAQGVNARADAQLEEVGNPRPRFERGDVTVHVVPLTVCVRVPRRSVGGSRLVVHRADLFHNPRGL